MPRMPRKVKIATGGSEKVAPVYCRKSQRNPAHDGSERKGCSSYLLAVLCRPAFPHGNDEAAYRFRIVRETVRIAAVLIKRSYNRSNEDSVAL
jgi:hypothetical protein